MRASTKSNWKSNMDPLKVKNSARVPSRFSHISITSVVVCHTLISISFPSEPDKRSQALPLNADHRAELRSNSEWPTLKVKLELQDTTVIIFP